MNRRTSGDIKQLGGGASKKAATVQLVVDPLKWM